MSGWGWAGMVAGTLLLVGVLVAGALLVVRAYRVPGGTALPPSPEQVLAGRFARGEIDEDELRSRLATLRDGGVGAN